MSQELERGLRYEAVRHFRGVENIRKTLFWIKEKPHEFTIRVLELGAVIDQINRLWEKGVDPDIHGNLVRLRVGMGMSDEELPTLVQLANRYREKALFDDPVFEMVNETFATIAKKIETVEWEFPTKITNNPGKVTSGFLIEGYGLFLEDYYKSPGLAEIFVLAFEEVLLTKFPLPNQLRDDVIDWMKADKEKFSSIIRDELERM